MEFTENEIRIIEKALLSRKFRLETVLKTGSLTDFVNKIYNDEIASISSLVSRFKDEYAKFKSAK